MAPPPAAEAGRTFVTMTSEKVPLAPQSPVPPSSTTAARGLFDTAMGPLQRQLRAGEYNIFKWASMFEADFVQVSKQGGALDVHNQVQLVRAAIVATSPSLQVPNVLLLARPLTPATDPRAPHKLPGNNNAGSNLITRFELTRLLPLCFVKISIHDRERQQLRFKLATGRTFYLQLLPPPSEGAAPSADFQAWVKVVHLLRPPADPSEEEAKAHDLATAAGLSLLHTPLPLSVDAPPEKEEEEGEEERGRGDEEEEGVEEEEEEEGPPLPLMEAPAGDIVSDSTWEEPPPLPTEESQMQWAKERAPPSRKNNPRSKSSKSRRSHSSKRASSRSRSRISSLFRSSFSSASLRSRKAANKSQDRKP